MKEKFGGLRFDADTRNPDLRAAFNERIKQAEELCGRSCETCGAPGELHDEFSWIRRLCDQHAAARTADEAERAPICVPADAVVDGDRRVGGPVSAIDLSPVTGIG